jgi:hypothetical protein
VITAEASFLREIKAMPGFRHGFFIWASASTFILVIAATPFAVVLYSAQVVLFGWLKVAG